MKVKCLIVEDEPIAQEILKSYIERTDFLEIAGQFSNAIEAFNFLQQHSIHLLFLDIKMPQMSGIELLKEINTRPKVIITSAYRYYATDAFELDVLDYLLKPYSFNRFAKGVNKVKETTVPSVSMASPTSQARENVYIYVKGNKQLQKVYIDDILYLESQRDYLRFKMINNQDIVTRQTIGYYEQFLPARAFLRIHRSFIISIDKISAVEATRIFIHNFPIPIGRNYKEHVSDYLKSIDVNK